MKRLFHKHVSRHFERPCIKSKASNNEEFNTQDEEEKVHVHVDMTENRFCRKLWWAKLQDLERKGHAQQLTDGFWRVSYEAWDTVLKDMCIRESNGERRDRSWKNLMLIM